MKGCGKTTVGKLLAKKLNVDFIDADYETEKMSQAITGESLTYREMFRKYGEKYFCEIETKSLKNIFQKYQNKNLILACGGRTTLISENQKILHKLGTIIYLKPNKEALYQRIIKNGIPAFFPYPNDPRRSFDQILRQRVLIYEKIADIILDCGTKTPEEIIALILNMNRIDGKTKIVGFFGSTYKTSKMYAVYNAAFRVLKLNYIYVPFIVNDLKKAVEGIRHLGIKAVGVTIPYKIVIIPYLDELDENAKRIGAVNVVVNNSGKLIGGNTDGLGGVLALKEKTTISGKKVILLGAGGAARALAFTLKDENANLIILNRTISAAKDLASAVKCRFGHLGQLGEETKTAHILINATNVGMAPNENESLVTKELLHKTLIVQELVSHPKETRLIKEAKSVGCKIVYGERMLFWQAVLKFKLFTI